MRRRSLPPGACDGYRSAVHGVSRRPPPPALPDTPSPLVRPTPRHPPAARTRRASDPSPSGAPEVRWRILVTPPFDGVANMALDEALLHRARDAGHAVLRVYSWGRPTLSLGRNQTARGRYDAGRAAALGIDVVRRPTGGRAVLHHREITYSVAAPVGLLGSLAESYHAINRLLLDGLQRLGVDAREAEPSGAAPLPGVSPCFETPVAGEITMRGRKLVGSAQVREDGALLQHGSILVDDDQSLAATLLLRPVAPPPAPATLRDALGRAPAPAELARALAAALGDPEPLALDDSLERAAGALRARYADPAWTWRR